MTIICTDGVTVASDSITTAGCERLQRPGRKLWLAKSGIVASAGIAGMVKHIADWLDAGAGVADMPKHLSEQEWQAMLLTPNSVMSYGNTSLYGWTNWPPFAIGAGDLPALGALHAGASPRRAAEIACAVRIDCGPPVVVAHISRSIAEGRLVDEHGQPTYAPHGTAISEAA